MSSNKQPAFVGQFKLLSWRNPNGETESGFLESAAQSHQFELFMWLLMKTSFVSMICCY